MNEIEQAIETLNVMQSTHSHIRKSNNEWEAIELSKEILRAELARQDAKPLTCDGCNFIREKYATHGGVTICCNCSRGTILPDRYEPKGETNA